MCHAREADCRMQGRQACAAMHGHMHLRAGSRQLAAVGWLKALDDHVQSRHVSSLSLSLSKPGQDAWQAWQGQHIRSWAVKGPGRLPEVKQRLTWTLCPMQPCGA